jgi:hypothetical protein
MAILSSKRTKALILLFAWILVLGMGIWLASVDLATTQKGYTICIYKNITGHNCPGCGTTRAIAAILQGKFAQAFSYNKLIIITFPLLLWIGCKSAMKSWQNIRLLLFHPSSEKSGARSTPKNTPIN